jgi:uncharacterized protein YciI
MQFAIIAYDLPGDEAHMRRLDARAEHMKGIRQLKIEGRILDGGALLDDSSRMSSSVALYDFPDRAALDVYLASESYMRKAGLVRRKFSHSRASTGIRCC